MSTLDTKTSRLIGSDRVEGTTVYNRSGEKIGSIKTVMIDKLTGKVAYAVMSFGGFLGVGDNYYPLPWSMLKYDTRLGGYVVDIDKKVLEGAPSYGPRERIDWDDENWVRRVHEHYGVDPYF
jgi:sporulation protein YlmC with PRC-barrel domain